MAGLLQPVDGFCREIAEIWIEDMRYPELAEYTVMNLFQRLPYASEVVFPWIADEREYFQLCGYLLMTRLLMKGWTLNERAEAEFWIRPLPYWKEEQKCVKWQPEQYVNSPCSQRQILVPYFVC